VQLLRTKRIFTRTAVYSAPKKFLLIALTSASGTSNIQPLLNDQLSISHYHASEDGFPNSNEAKGSISESNGDSMPSDASYSTGKSRLRYPSEALLNHEVSELLMLLWNEDSRSSCRI
jgi:hypothetical protein